MIELRRQALSRYIMPLREGGSLPALAEADDDFKYVVKFKGGGHGAKAVISELVGGEIARRAGLRVPELVFLDLNEDFGRTEGDEEIQDLLRASTGTNLGLSFLAGAYSWDVAVNTTDPLMASRIVWLDAFLTNVDRTALNTNMLWWNRELWLIDHGSSLYFHHNWTGWEKAAVSPFPYIEKHALLPLACELDQVDEDMHRVITPAFLEEVVNLIPDEWLAESFPEIPVQEQRKVYLDFLITRLSNSKIFVDHANAVRKTLI